MNQSNSQMITLSARSSAIQADFLKSSHQASDSNNVIKNSITEPDRENELDPFVHEIAVCIDCMLQDDAMGQTITFVRNGSDLVTTVVSADSIDLSNLQQYEMVLFDGGNTSGDRWKHVFFPQQEQHQYVDENPLPRLAGDTAATS